MIQHYIHYGRILTEVATTHTHGQKDQYMDCIWTIDPVGMGQSNSNDKGDMVGVKVFQFWRGTLLRKRMLRGLE